MAQDKTIRVLAYAAMNKVWRFEWHDLTPVDRTNIATDFISANCSASEYHDRIYTGNLQSYANTIN